MHKHQTYIFRKLVLSAFPSLNKIKSDKARTMIAGLKPGGGGEGGVERERAKILDTSRLVSRDGLKSSGQNIIHSIASESLMGC